MRQAIEILRRRKRLLIIPLVVVFLLPALYSLAFMRSYEANTLIWIDSDVSVAEVLQAQGAAALSDRPIQSEADTLQQLLESRAFIVKVIEQTSLQVKMNTPKGRENTIAFIRKNVRSEVVGPNSLKITFYGRSPGEAVAVVGVLNDAFLAWVQDTVKEQNEKSVSFFSQQSDTYRAELDKARTALQKYQEQHPETEQLEIADKVLSAPKITASPAVQSEYKRRKSQAEYAQEVYDSSLSDLGKVRVLSAAREERYMNGLRTIDGPVEPTTFSKKRLLLFDFLALMAAVIIGVMAVVIAEITDVTLRSERDVEEVLELPVVTELPQRQSVKQS